MDKDGIFTCTKCGKQMPITIENLERGKNAKA